VVGVRLLRDNLVAANYAIFAVRLGFTIKGRGVGPFSLSTNFWGFRPTGSAKAESLLLGAGGPKVLQNTA
jgi:hypothetical protein